MGFLSFFDKLLCRRWRGTPEQYLAMVQYIASQNHADYGAKELLQWGEVMQRVMKVDLRPYTDFRDLAIHGNPDYSLVEKIDAQFTEFNRRRDLKQAIYGPEADLGENDMMKRNDRGSVFARRFIETYPSMSNFLKKISESWTSYN